MESHLKLYKRDEMKHQRLDREEWRHFIFQDSQGYSNLFQGTVKENLNKKCYFIGNFAGQYRVTNFCCDLKKFKMFGKVTIELTFLYWWIPYGSSMNNAMFFCGSSRPPFSPMLYVIFKAYFIFLLFYRSFSTFSIYKN